MLREMPTRAMTWSRLCALATKLPGVTVDTWWGTPGFKVRGKGFARLKEDGHSVMFSLDNLDTKEALLAALPEIYFTTDHYNGHAAVLARLATLTRGEAMERLEHAWRLIAGDPAAALRPARERTTRAASKTAARKQTTRAASKTAARKQATRAASKTAARKQTTRAASKSANRSSAARRAVRKLRTV